MSTAAVSTGMFALEDNADVETCLNYSTTAIADGACVVIDQTNISKTKGAAAVAAAATATLAQRVGIAKGIIPAATTQAGVTVPGQGQMVVGGFAKALAASATFTAGNRVIAADGGLVAEGTTAGQIIGYVAITEGVATTRPYIRVAFS